MAEKLSGVNGKIIRWARNLYNMTPEQAAKSIGVDVERYNKWELGEEFPTYAKLKKISNVFHKPSVIFFFPEPPAIPKIKGDLRTLPDTIINTFSKQIIVQFEKAKVYQLNLQELYTNSESIIAQRHFFPNNIEELCSFFREKLDVPLTMQKKPRKTSAVFELFRERFYNLGIYVFKDAFEDNSISGLSLNDNCYPVIIINNSMSFSRQIFTLFHELYHLISDTSGAEIIREDYYVELNEQQKIIERACDSFANDFLVPMSDFQKEIKGKTLNEEFIEELSKMYSVSREAIMYKLYKMGKITPRQYESMKSSFYKDAIRRKNNTPSQGNHYNTKLSYLGKRYTGDVFSQYYSGKINVLRASEMLQSKIDHLPKLEDVFWGRVGR